MSSSRELNTFWQSVASDIGVPVNGLAFIYDAFDYARQQPDHRDNESLRHFSAADYCDAFVRFAKDIFGEHYVSALKSWGLDTSDKVGCVIFELVERGLIDRQESDCQSDFHGQFDFSNISAPELEFVTYQTPVKSHIYGPLERIRKFGLRLLVTGLMVYCILLIAAKLADVLKPVPYTVIVSAFVFAYVFIESLLRRDVRYSLRTLLIGMTLVALVLGLFTALMR